MKIKCTACDYVGKPSVLASGITVCPECGAEIVEDSTSRWASPFDTCDICGGKIKGVAEYFVDGCTKAGPWALMCPKCFERHGVGVRYGLGQKYDGTTGALLAGGQISWKFGTSKVK